MNLENKTYREQLFIHLDGITIIPTIAAIHKLGILDFINKNQSFYLSDIIDNNNTLNNGYLNIAIRNLLSINILSINDKEKYSDIKKYYVSHKKLNQIISIIDNNDFNKLISIYLNFDKDLNMPGTDYDRKKTDSLYNIIKNMEGINNSLYYYVEGLVLGPILSYLGYLNISFKDIKNDILYKFVIDIFKLTKLINDNLDLTEKGYFFNKRCSSYGVTTSYLPLLNNLDKLISKKENIVWMRDKKGYELHVMRRMNVWGSGGAHKFYFKKIDDLIINIFNQDIKNQPKGITDMGCGDGTFLEHCYSIIMDKTLRGKYIKEYPLKLIGADINKAARIATREKLNKSNIDNIVINGNISDPYSLNKILKDEYNEDLNDFLSTRTFLDHNRIYSKPNEVKNYNIKTTGAFCYRGNFIRNIDMINNLIEHLSNWKKYVNKYGLIILELHTIPPNLIKNNIGKTLACAYDTTHGFSDQYLIEYEAFIKCANSAGLKLNQDSILFPDSSIPTISINYFK